MVPRLCGYRRGGGAEGKELSRAIRLLIFWRSSSIFGLKMTTPDASARSRVSSSQPPVKRTHSRMAPRARRSIARSSPLPGVRLISRTPKAKGPAASAAARAATSELAVVTTCPSDVSKRSSVRNSSGSSSTRRTFFLGGWTLSVSLIDCAYTIVRGTLVDTPRMLSKFRGKENYHPRGG